MTLTRLPSATLDKHLAILATSDAGKTYGAKGEVEQLLDAGKRICIIDPTGVWWGLRLKPDGKAPSGYDLPIFGGAGPRGGAPFHTDVPVSDKQGGRVAELVAGGDFSAIVDVSKMSIAGRTRFLADFAETLSQESRRPLHLVIDEAHLMMPQTIMGGDVDSARMVGAANHLVSGGRALGLRIMLLSQRPAKLHNDSLTQVQTLVAMFTMSPADIAPAKKWVTANADPAAAKELLASLPTLKVGHGWVYAPRLGVLERVAFGAIRTFDSSAAPTDEDVERRGMWLAPLDLEALRAELHAEAPAAADAPRASLDQAAITAAEARGFERGYASGERTERAKLEKSLVAHPEVQRALRWTERAARHGAYKDILAFFTRELGRVVAELAPAAPPMLLVEQLRAGAADAKPEPPALPDEDPAAALTAGAPQEASPPPVDVEPAGAPPRRTRRARADAAEGELNDAAQALIAAARSAHRPVGWAEAAVLAGRIPQGGSFEAARRKLLDNGWAEPCPNDLDPDAALPWAEVLDLLTPKVAAGKKASAHAPDAFRVLAEVGARSREGMADFLNIQPRGGHFEHLWRTLRRSPLVEELPDGRLDVIPILRELRARAQEES